MKANTDGHYPRPTLVREAWTSLDGTWDFAYDDDAVGLTQRWFDRGSPAAFPERIEVPYPPESPASGLGRTEIHPVVWYRRTFSSPGASPDQRVLLHLGAVDHLARIWVDGQLVTTHAGGFSPIDVDITDALDLSAASRGEDHVLVVRAEDDPSDPDQARGKQDWLEQTHGIWYERTTGIWQPVWLEVVPADHVESLVWTGDPAHGVRGEVALSRRSARPLSLSVSVSYDDEVLASQTVQVTSREVRLDVPLEVLRNAHERPRLQWTPEDPRLLDVVVRLQDGDTVVDEVASYTGLRTIAVEDGQLRLNGMPYYVRAVLNQGYRPETHLAARDTDELRTEVETIKAMGFNCSRNHQKSEDPRWLYWADRLGLMVWGEAAAHYGFSPTAVERFVPEWLALVRRDRSHPSVCLWVPVNESWGVPDLPGDPAQRSYVRALADLTRAVDPSRPVVTNEGWEHVDSDVLGLHDYTTDPQELRARYATPDAVRRVVADGRTPHGRRSVVSESQLRAYDQGATPVMVTEFGGVSFAADGDTWGYAEVGSDSEYSALLQGLFDALRASDQVSGFCYTQYLDTGQETNGLLYADGTPKLPLETIRQIVTGEKQ